MGQPIPAAGAEFGLTPLRPELHTTVVVPYTSESIVSEGDYTKGTEFGGVDGVVQPPPHRSTARERRSMVMFLDPADPGDGSPGSLAPPDLEGDFT